MSNDEHFGNLGTLFPRASRSFLEANRKDYLPKTVIERAATAPKPTVKPLKPKMTKAEAEMALILKAKYPEAEIKFGSVKVRLANDCWYTPDFAVHLPDGQSVIIEVKGGRIWDGSKEKFRIAREQYPFWTWELHQKTKEGWTQLL